MEAHIYVNHARFPSDFCFVMRHVFFFLGLLMETRFFSCCVFRYNVFVLTFVLKAGRCLWNTSFVRTFQIWNLFWVSFRLQSPGGEGGPWDLAEIFLADRLLGGA